MKLFDLVRCPHPVMRMRRFSALMMLAAVSCASPALPAENTAVGPRSPFEMPPFPALSAYAVRQGIPLQGIVLAPEDSLPQAGDEAVYLMTLQQSAGFKQWIVRLIAATPDTGPESKPLPEDTIFTSTGLELRYSHRPAALKIEFIGPFDSQTRVDSPIPVKHGRTIVSAESLERGLVHYCASSLEINRRLQAAGISQPHYYGIGRRPEPTAVEAGRRAAEAFQLSAEEERLAFSVYFALRSFYSAATEVPACRDVLEHVLQKPSLWSVAGNLGLNPNFVYGWQDVIRLPDGVMPLPAPVYALPVKLALNNRPALKASLAVSTTQPPLRHCAGIVSLVAEHPTDASKRVFLHLMASRPAASVASGP